MLYTQRNHCCVLILSCLFEIWRVSVSSECFNILRRTQTRTYTDCTAYGQTISFNNNNV